MSEYHDALQALAYTLNQEREERTLILAHAIKSLRGTALMLDALILGNGNDSMYFKLEAVQVHVNDIQLWLEDQLKQEVERQSIINENGENKTLH